MGRLIDVKPKAGLVDVKPNSALLLNTKPVAGQLNRATEDDVVTRLSSGMPIGPGFFMFLTYPQEIKVLP